MQHIVMHVSTALFLLHNEIKLTTGAAWRGPYTSCLRADEVGIIFL